ncbi:Agmatinase [Nonlabens tegetincola]|uniref:Agmatinase n=1 Tax=Nonlabens tegetincola TaxID=323273 RepID=A0A090Q4J9_9FLAO|nr:agmatinase [Nonlabens tegetincola]GAK97920.1 Agmatinase [Nonlabens tegetincola]
MKLSSTYAGIPDEFGNLNNAKTVLIPVPYDGTSTWGKGADKGPDAFLEASENMELYDIETNTEVYKQGIYLAPTIDENSSPDAMVNAVYTAVKGHVNRNKFVTLFGGEHSISIGAMRAMNEQYQDLSVLQLDAHADLRKEYMGSPYNHACAMYEANENMNLVQVGIRSMDVAETTVMNKDQVYFAHEMITDDYWMDSAIDALTDDVYITFDLDAFDPSILPATGTPEPGGLQWYETLEFLRRVFEERNVVGFDIVELCATGDYKASAFAAAKLYYKMLSYKFASDEQDHDGDYAFAKAEKNNVKSEKIEDDEY